MDPDVRKAFEAMVEEYLSATILDHPELRNGLRDHEVTVEKIENVRVREYVDEPDTLTIVSGKKLPLTVTGTLQFIGERPSLQSARLYSNFRACFSCLYRPTTQDFACDSITGLQFGQPKTTQF